MKLKPFPFRCDAPKITQGGGAVISASFQIGEPYGVVTMRCERSPGGVLVQLSTDGNIRGRITANSMAKHIVARLS